MYGKINWYSLSDPAIVRELSSQVKQMRINKNITQQELAERTGLDRVTISRFENGRAATLLTFVEILRALDKLELLSNFHEEPTVSPIQVAEAQEHYRKRASRKAPTDQKPGAEW